MVCRLTVVVGLAISLMLARQASADPIGPDAFTSPTLIDFESAPDGPIDSRYNGLGVTFSELFGGGFADVGTGSAITGVATNFPVFVGCPPAGCPDASARFSNLNTRVGFYVSTNPADDLTILAYRGTSLVGSEFFRTGGGGHGGTFAGVEFASGFDRIDLDTTNVENGALVIDDFRFEGSPAPVPEPATLILFATGLVGVRRCRLRMLACLGRFDAPTIAETL
jgi:PEP-CTERM motif-containing protein